MVVIGAFALVVVALPARNVWMILLAVLLVVVVIAWFRSPPLDLIFEVGDRVRHRVAVHVAKFWGTLSVTVDGSSARHEIRRYSVGLTRTYVVTVGQPVRHEVKVEQDRAAFSAGSRPQPVRVYVDDVLTASGIA